MFRIHGFRVKAKSKSQGRRFSEVGGKSRAALHRRLRLESLEDRRLLSTYTIHPEDFGAVANGTTDCTAAFEKMVTNPSDPAHPGIVQLQASYLDITVSMSQANGGTYLVGHETMGAGGNGTPYYYSDLIFYLNNSLPNFHLAIDGQGATVKMRDGMHIGSFYPTGNPNQGQRYNPSSLPFTDGSYQAAPGPIFMIMGCDTVGIHDLSINGNNANMVLGGLFGDNGRQVSACGIELNNCENVTVDNVTSSYCGLDGLYMRDPGTSPLQHWTVSNSTFEYNARQGFSWTGGKGLTVTNCKFNHTGRVVVGGEQFSSPPSAGVDIEPSAAAIAHGLFVSCDFVNNRTCGMIATSGSQDVTFQNCLFWGTDYWSVWPGSPQYVFENCTIRGSMGAHQYSSSNPGLATQFWNCRFDDLDSSDGVSYQGVGYSTYLNAAVVAANGNNILFDGCTVIAKHTKALYLDGTSTREIVRNCSVYHQWADPVDGDFLSMLRGGSVENTHFYEEGLGSNQYYILAGTLDIGPGVFVDGPQCKWGNWSSGRTGEIPVIRTASPMGGWWKLDEGSGVSATDSLGNSNTGTLTNGPSWVTPGYIGNAALSFDGVNDYVSVANSSSLNITSAITVSAWIKPNRVNTYQNIVCKGAYGYCLDLNDTGKVRLLIGTGAGWNVIAVGGTTLSPGVWYHLAGTYDSATGTACVYLNGVLDGISTNNILAIGTSSNPLSIGSASSYTSNYFFQGVIDDVRLYGRALSQSQVQTVMNMLRGRWRFEEINPQSTQTSDSTGYSPAGTLMGSPTSYCVPGPQTGSALHFDGISDYVSVPDDSDLRLTNAVTVSAWIRPEKAGAEQVIACKGAYSYLLELNSTGQVQLYIGDGSNWNVTVAGGTTLSTGVWYHVTGTYDSGTGTAYVYVNGVQDGSATGTAQPIGTNTSTLSIGSASSYTSNYFFQGAIDDVRVYARALTTSATASQSELYSVMTADAPGGSWKFNETSGSSASDSSGYGNPGTLTNMSPPGCWVAGQLNSALQFDGVDDYVSVADALSLDMTSAVTVSAWIKPSRVDANQIIACKGQYTYLLEVTYTGQVELAIGNGSSWTAIAVGGTTLSPGVWYHVTGTYDSATKGACVYLNGVLDGSATSTAQSIGANTSTLSIGSASSYTSNYFFQGIIDDLRIYNRTLNPLEVKSAMSTLAGWWRFDESSGTTASDSSGSGGQGTVMNGPTWVSGYAGNALSLDGVDDYVSVADNSAFQITQAITVSAWIKPSRVNTKQVIACKGQYTYLLELNSTGQVQLYIGDGSNWNVTVAGGTTLSTGVWYHVTGTYDSAIGTACVYLNGVLDGTGTSMAQPIGANTSTLSIGSASSYTSNYFFQGVIDDLCIYNRALNPLEIKGAMDMLAGWWRFDESSGTTASDSSGCGGQGTLNGPTWLPGRVGSALSFDGVNDYVSVAPNPWIEVTSAVTLSAWIKPSRVDTYQTIASKGGQSLMLRLNDTGHVQMYAGTGGSGSWFVSATGGTTLSTGVWYHVAGTYDSATGKAYVYVNGVLDGNGTCTPQVVGGNNGCPLTIGSFNYPTLNYFFQGIIDDVRMYSRALNQPEIRSVMNTLAGWWRFDEVSGTTALDSNGYAGRGTLNGPTRVTGYVGNALLFDGTDDYASVANNWALQMTQAVTVSAWIKPSQVNTEQVIACKGQYTYLLELNSTGQVQLCIGNGSSWNVTAAGGTTLNTGVWYHVAGTYDAATGTACVYLNGILDGNATGTAQAIGTNANPLSIGSASSYTSTYFFQGILDDVRIYSGALNELEIRSVMNMLAGCWRFNESSGTTASDSSGCAGPGNLNGPTWVTGYIGNALSFDGTDDYVSVADTSSLEMSSAVTVSAWIKPSRVNTEQVIACKGQYTYLLELTSTGQVQLKIGNGTSWNVTAASETTLSPGVWYHVTGTYDAATGTACVYLNGDLDGSGTSTAEAIGTNTNPLSIGSASSYTSNYFFQGIIDDVHVYNVALSSAAVVALHAIPGDLNGDGFVGAADLDIIRSHWGQQVTPGDWRQGDPSGDGLVGGADLDIMRANWGQGTPPVPPAPPAPSVPLATSLVGSTVQAASQPSGQAASLMETVNAKTLAASHSGIVKKPMATLAARAHDAIMADFHRRESLEHRIALAQAAWWSDLQQWRTSRQSQDASESKVADAALVA